jgi:hypothetical protein
MFIFTGYDVCIHCNLNRSCSIYRQYQLDYWQQRQRMVQQKFGAHPISFVNMSVNMIDYRIGCGIVHSHRIRRFF